MHDDENLLLLAVEALTKPVTSKVIQDGPIGSGLAGQKTVSVKLPSLLEQLEAAIRGTIGKGGSGSLANERNMLDADALYRMVKIATLVHQWAHSFKADITKGDVSKTLVAWYIKYQVTNPTETSERFYLNKMTAWANEIRDKLNPAKVLLQPGACPVCGAETWWSKATHEEYKFPLVIEYHEIGANLVQEAKAMCRACEQVWSVRELAYALEQADKAAELPA